MSPVDAFAYFGISLAAEMNGCASAADAASRVQRLKDRVQETFKDRARRLHPDVGGPDANEEAMKRLSAARDHVMDCEVVRPRPVPVVRVYQWTSYTGDLSDSTTTSTSAGFTMWGTG